MIVNWNQTARDYHTGKRLHELVAEQVVRSPDAVAIEFEGDQMSFAALDRRANRLAHVLVQHGVGPDLAVGICTERSLEMIIGLLGILKAGGAYVPLDPTSPRARLAFMLAETRAPIVLAQRDLVSLLPEHDSAIVFLDPPREIDDLAERPPTVDIEPDHLAYVFYTSGSTGRPKGVMNSHRAICNFVQWMQKAYGLTPDDRVLQKTPYSFDISIGEIFWPLITGARLIIARPGGHREPAYLSHMISTHGVTNVQFVPSMLRAFLDAPNLDSIGCLKRVFSSGEALPPDLRDAFVRRIDAELHNLYGPTEAAVEVTAFRCDEQPPLAPVLIGRPIANTTVHVLDAQLQPVPIGSTGELFIGGVQLARGYLRRPGLTAERFIPDPFGAPGCRLYRTGDLARYQPDGNIEFLGRNDDQVKIRGFRIELGEIEASLVAQPDVRAAAVVVHERADGDQRLVGFVTPAPATTPDPSALRRGLEQRLPAHMVPSAIMVIDALPLTPSGKLDRRRLAGTAPAARDAAEPLVPPRNQLESIIADAFAEVLGVARVGIHDDFAAAGGHSLLAAQLIARLRDRCDVELLVSTIFEHPTVAALAVIVERAQRTRSEHRSTPLVAVPRERAELPLSFGQQRLWFLDQVGAGNAYNLFRGWRFHGQLDRRAMALAIRELVDRHESLRTRFPTVDGQPVQVVDPAGQTELLAVDLCGRPEWEARAEADRRVGREIRTPFDLADGPVFRATLVSVCDDEHWLLLGMHHIVSDGWSLDVLQRDLVALYEARVTGVAATLPALSIQCADYAAWDRSRLQDAAGETSLAYWRTKLADLPELDLPTVFRRGSAPTREGAAVEFVVPNDVVARLRTLIRRERATTAMVMQAVYTTLLHRHTGQDDVVIGAAVANRNHGELENLIGFFVDSVVMRTDHGGDPTFAELLGRTRDVAMEAYDHQDIPFERLVGELQPHRNLGRNPLFQVLFTMEGTPPPTMTPGNMPNGLTMETIDPEATTARFDLALYVFESPEGLSGRFVYDTKLFRPATAERITKHYLNLLDAATADPTTHLSALPLVTDADRDRAIASWNDADLRSEANEPAGDFDLLAIVDGICDRFQDEPAIRIGSRSIPYGELDRASRRIATALQAGALPTGGTVTVCLRDRAQVIASMLGIWRAGGVFVPLDPDGPEARLHGILETVRPACMLVDEQDMAHIEPRTEDAAASPSMIAFIPGNDADWCRGTLQPAGLSLDTFDIDEQHVAVAPDAMAYIYHTSGSTGRPKGIAGTLRGLAHFVRWEIDTFAVGPGTRVSQLTVPTFDPFFRDVLVPMCAGGTICVPPADVRLDPPALLAWIDEQRVQLVHSVPSFFSLLADEALDPERLRALEHVLLAGEVLPVDFVRDWMSVFGTRITLVNIYGPSESTMAKLYHVVEPAGVARRFIPIGKPIPGCRATLIDDAGNMSVPGTVGELLLRSPYLTKGYFDDPEQTQRRFVPNPLRDDANDVVYRTGDLARQLDDGSFQFVGRMDNQVKIRGIRIELEEVESAIRAEPAVRDATVVCREDDPGARHLVAYVVPNAGSDRLRDRLRERLQRSLPGVMVPSAFVLLDALPLNPNGKVDRRALPIPDRSAATAVAFVPPRTPTEERLATIWADVLRLDRIGINDNFFELGGDSIRSIQVIARARKKGLHLLPQHAFEHQTIATLAATAESTERVPIAAEQEPVNVPLVHIDPAALDELTARYGSSNIEDVYPLSPMQLGMAYHTARDDRTGVYVQQRRLTIDDLDAVAFREAWAHVISHHAVLRTCVVGIDAEIPRQVVLRSVDFPWVEQDDRSLDDDERRERLTRFLDQDRSRDFELAEAPLLRLALIRVGDGRWEFVWTYHHLLLDGWSAHLIWDDLFGTYDALRQRTDPARSASVPYRAYIEWLGRQDPADVDAYWRRTLAGFTEPTVLGIDRAPGQRTAGVRDYDGITRALPEELTTSLRQVAARNRVTLNALCMGAWAVLLSRYSGASDVLFGTVDSGRRPDIDGIESMVGLLINTQPTRVQVEPEASFAAWLGPLQDGLVQQREFGHGALWRAHQQSEISADTPLFENLFVFENYPPHRVDPSGCSLNVRRHRSIDRTGYPVTMVVTPGSKLEVQLLFDRDRFDRASIERMVRHYLNLLQEATRRPGAHIGDLPMLDSAERRQLIMGWNDTTRQYPRDESVPTLFSAQAARTPGAIAVTYGTDEITFTALDDRSDQLADHLRSKGVTRGDRVAICLERGIDQIVAMIGVLKAGAAYVPLDPAHPSSRLALMLDDAGARTLLTQAALRDKLPDVTHATICLDSDWPAIAATPGAAAPAATSADDLAYVIYTSGSTGKPKGVCVPHRAIVRLVLGTDYVQLDAGDRVAQAANASFDAATFEMWGALLTGACIVGLDSDKTLDPRRFAEVIRDRGITVLFITTALFNQVTTDVPGIFSQLRCLLFGGETADPARVRSVLENRPPQRLLHVYGPTENTTFSTWHEVSHVPADARAVPIGRPIANSTMYVLDPTGQPTPIGVSGELYLGGDGLAVGYLNDPKLSASRFVPHPFLPGERLYRTGDLVRMRADGSADFVGRRDHQVKVRGFRIELGEIETALLQTPEVRDAVVLCHEDEPGHKRLVAYVVAAEGQTIEWDELRAHLRGKLPGYMVPSVVVELDAMPLNVNGKVNRRSLPTPDAGTARTRECAAPQTENEHALAVIWADVLSESTIGIHDDFFNDLGGHSLLAMRIVNQVRSRMGVELSIRLLFDQPTIARLAGTIERLDWVGPEDQPAPNDEREGGWI